MAERWLWSGRMAKLMREWSSIAMCRYSARPIPFRRIEIGRVRQRVEQLGPTLLHALAHPTDFASVEIVQFPATAFPKLRSHVPLPKNLGNIIPPRCTLVRQRGSAPLVLIDQFRVSNSYAPFRHYGSLVWLASQAQRIDVQLSRIKTG